MKRSRINPISDKQKIERQKEKDLKILLLLKYGKVCMTCGARNPWPPLELSHKIGTWEGGETTEENCILECWRCHHGKCHREIKE